MAILRLWWLCNDQNDKIHLTKTSHLSGGVEESACILFSCCAHRLPFQSLYLCWMLPLQKMLTNLGAVSWHWVKWLYSTDKQTSWCVSRFAPHPHDAPLHCIQYSFCYFVDHGKVRRWMLAIGKEIDKKLHPICLKVHQILLSKR